MLEYLFENIVLLLSLVFFVAVIVMGGLSLRQSFRSRLDLQEEVSDLRAATGKMNKTVRALGRATNALQKRFEEIRESGHDSWGIAREGEPIECSCSFCTVEIPSTEIFCGHCEEHGCRS